MIEKKFKDGKVTVINNTKAHKYIEFQVTNDFKMGAFLDILGEVIGINNYSEITIYHTKKFIEKYYISKGKELNTVPENADEYISWWNEECYEKPKSYEEVQIPFSEMKKYFTETITKDQSTVWYTYYLNPPVGLTVKLGEDSEVSFSSQRINKIMVVQSTDMEYDNMIYCFDKNDQFVEDIDVTTNLPLSKIRFIFEFGDLESASTVNQEQQLFVELWEQISPYLNVDENRKALKNWLRNYEKFENEN